MFDGRQAIWDVLVTWTGSLLSAFTWLRSQLENICHTKACKEPFKDLLWFSINEYQCINQSTGNKNSHLKVPKIAQRTWSPYRATLLFGRFIGTGRGAEGGLLPDAAVQNAERSTPTLILTRWPGTVQEYWMIMASKCYVVNVICPKQSRPTSACEAYDKSTASACHEATPLAVRSVGATAPNSTRRDNLLRKVVVIRQHTRLPQE